MTFRSYAVNLALNNDRERNLPHAVLRGIVQIANCCGNAVTAFYQSICILEDDFRSARRARGDTWKDERKMHANHLSKEWRDVLERKKRTVNRVKCIHDEEIGKEEANHYVHHLTGEERVPVL